MSARAKTGQPGWLLYAVLLALLGVIIAGGYGVFRLFALDVMPDAGAYNLLALAVIAGGASFFSPCAFPLLPGYLSLYYAGVDKSAAAADSSTRRAVRLGLAAALGVVTFDLALGAVIGLLGASIGEGLSISGPQPSDFVRVFRGAVGVVLMLLGIAQLRGVNLKPRLADALVFRTRPRRDRAADQPARSLYLYGLGYTAAGMGCTGPILAGLTVFALSSGGFGAALSAFVVFSATMGTLMLLLSLLIAASEDALIHRLKAATPRIKTGASVLLVAVGLFNIITSIEVGGFTRLLFP